MHIAIITNQTPLNYGANLQAYALQTYLEKQGCEAEVIDYAPDYYTDHLSLKHVGDPKFKKHFLLRWAYIFYKLPSRWRRINNFAGFQKHYLHLTARRYKSYDELLGYPPEADGYIVGSDQVWNTHGTRGYNPAFYLEFVKDSAKRASYAASMAIDTPISDRVKRDVFPMINKLQHVSVRESMTIDIIQPYVNKKIHHVLDPVYLLSADDWNRFTGMSDSKEGNYILIYPMGDGKDVVEKANVLAKHTGLPIYCISASKRSFPGVAKRFDCSVVKFVELFAKARYIVTDSFHGTSFSIIYRKVFWTCEVGHNNHRLVSLLQGFGLESRYVAKGEQIDATALSVDYALAEPCVKEAIAHSKAYLGMVIDDMKSEKK